MTLSPADYVLAYSAGLIAVIFAISGAAKMSDSASTLRAMRAMRVPRALQKSWVAAALPLGEIVLAVAFVFTSGPVRVAAGVLAVAMLLAFTLAILGVLRHGDEVDCGCFGPLAASDRITGWSLARNVALIAIAATVAWFGSHTDNLVAMLLAGPAVMTLGIAFAWALTTIAVLVRSVILARRNMNRTTATPDEAPDIPPMSQDSLAMGLDPSRPGEPAMGTSIPDGELVTGGGVTQPLVELGYGRPVLLIFLSAECGSCRSVAAAVPRWQRVLAPVEVRVATSSHPEAVVQRMPEIVPVVRYGGGPARRSFGVQRTPAAVALGGQEHPVVASPIVYGIDEMEGLVASLVAAGGRPKSVSPF